MKLEKSNGKIIQNPGIEELNDAIAKIGGELDFCILSQDGTFIQTAASQDGLIIQYSDSSGLFESSRDDFDISTVQDFFQQFLENKNEWKTAAEFTTVQVQNDDTSTEGGISGGPQHTQKSFKETLADSVKQEALNGVNRAAKRLTRGFIKKLF